IQNFALASDFRLGRLLEFFGVTVTPDTFGYAVWKLTIAQVGPVLPFLLLVLILIVRPRGLMGTRET
ncbi:MAG: branched-chain amino acid ABC transporter permease, partial [Burkholderiaceae bacterium]|nr:branched-chain amino acid ABC transporter permease [Burkholderiaceae bacterium]